MSQLPVFFGVQLLGTCMWLAFGPRRELGLAMAFGFLIGLAIVVLLSFPLLLLGVFTPLAVVALWTVLLAASVWTAVRRDRQESGTVLRTIVWALGFTALCIPACAWNVSVWSYDSHQFVFYARVLQNDHQLYLDTISSLNSWGSFQIVAHALAIVTWEDHLYALPTAFSLSFLAGFYVALDRGLGELGVSARRRKAASLVVLSLLIAIPLVRLHTVYIHANWAAAGYLFAFVALFWLADVTADARFVGGAFLALLAFCFDRVESPVFAPVFLVIALSQTRHARSAIVWPYLGFTIVLLSWLVALAVSVPESGVFLTTSRCQLMIAATSGVFVAFLLRDTGFMQRVVPHAPRLVAILCVLGITVAVATHLDVFRLSFTSWQRDLWLGGFWGYFLWPTFLVLAVLSVRVSPPSCSRSLRYMIVLFFGLVTLLSSLSHEYSKGRHGGLTRLTLHIVPTIWFYFGLVFIPAIYRRRRASADDAPVAVVDGERML